MVLLALWLGASLLIGALWALAALFLREPRRADFERGAGAEDEAA